MTWEVGVIASQIILFNMIGGDAFCDVHKSTYVYFLLKVTKAKEVV